MRLIPPILVLILLLAMVVLRIVLPGAVVVSYPYNLVGAAVVALGLFLSFTVARNFFRIGTNIKTFNEPGVLVTSGVFRWTRNPIYLGFVLMLSGAAILLGTASPFLAVALFAITADRWYIPFEERALERKFGQDYAIYKERTRRWL